MIRLNFSTSVECCSFLKIINVTMTRKKKNNWKQRHWHRILKTNDTETQRYFYPFESISDYSTFLKSAPIDAWLSYINFLFSALSFPKNRRWSGYLYENISFVDENHLDACRQNEKLRWPYTKKWVDCCVCELLLFFLYFPIHRSAREYIIVVLNVV